MIEVELLYYPGCSLKNSYPEFELSALEACEKLGVKLLEIPDWACCGVNPSLATDNVMRHLGVVHSLINAREKGREIGTNVVATGCSMCYNVFRRVNLILRDEPDALETVNAFMDDQPDYVPEVEVVHLLTVLREMGFEKIQEEVIKPLKGLKVASYYGCALLRPNKPEGIPIDDPENPTVLEDLMRGLGAEPVEFPFKVECCGNYHVALRPDIVEMRTRKIIGSAKSRGANLLVSSCPLCSYNLERGNEALREEERIPVVFFTQLLALALGADPHLNEKLKGRILSWMGGDGLA